MEDRTKQSPTDSAGRGGDAVPLPTTIDAIRHPWDANSILDRAIAIWDSDSTSDVLIVLPRGEAAKMENRLRVKLAAVRKELKRAGAATKQFGFESTILRWTLLDGTEHEALCLSRVVYSRHTIIEAFDSLLGDKQ